MGKKTYGSGTVQEAAQRLFDAGAHPAQKFLLKCRFGKRHIEAVRSDGTTYCVECLAEVGQ